MTIKRQPLAETVSIPLNEAMPLSGLHFHANPDTDNRRVLKYAQELLKKLSEAGVVTSVSFTQNGIRTTLVAEGVVA